MRVVYRVGHAGKTSQPYDPGAVHGGIREVDCNFIMARAAFDAGKGSGLDAFMSSHMEYAECSNWAVRNGVRVYLAIHTNASADPSADIGKFFYHHETSHGNGDRLAAILAEEMSDLGSKLLGKPYRCQATECRPATPSNPKEWTRNAYYTIKKFGRSVRGIGICCEPFFLSNPEHRRVFCQPKALVQIGEAYHRGVSRWATERKLIT